MHPHPSDCSSTLPWWSGSCPPQTAGWGSHLLAAQPGTKRKVKLASHSWKKSFHKNISSNMIVFFFDLYSANRNIQWRGVSRGVLCCCQFRAFLNSPEPGSNSEMNTF